VLALLAATGRVSVPVVSAAGLGVAGAVLIVEGATRRCLPYRAPVIDRRPGLTPVRRPVRTTGA